MSNQSMVFSRRAMHLEIVQVADLLLVAPGSRLLLAGPLREPVGSLRSLRGICLRCWSEATRVARAAASPCVVALL